MLALNPVIQIFKPVSPLAWLPISWRSLTWQTVCHFVIFITSLWPTIINTALGVSSVSKDYIDVARVLEMPRWRRITKLSGLPACLYTYESVWGLLVIVAVNAHRWYWHRLFLWDEWSRLNLSSVFLAVLVIGLTGLLLDYAVGRMRF